MTSPSWKVYSILPSILFEELLWENKKIVFKDFNPYCKTIYENYQEKVFFISDCFNKLKYAETKWRLQSQFASYVKLDELGFNVGLLGSFRRVFSCKRKSNNSINSEEALYQIQTSVFFNAKSLPHYWEHPALACKCCFWAQGLQTCWYYSD